MRRTSPAELLSKAADASRKAYCPYSKYKVGAALLAKDGTVFTGCNIENASYGLTVCAERAAFSAAISAGKRKFRAIAIVAGGRTMPYPCGACRQVMAEFCGGDFRIYCATAAHPEKKEEFRLAALLPKSFML